MAQATSARPLVWPPQQIPFDAAALAVTAPGLVLTTFELDPIYVNSAALDILAYPPHSSSSLSDVRTSLRTVMPAESFQPPTAVPFISGRRQYLCRSMVLQSRVSDAQPHILALLLERRPREPLLLNEMSRRFRLSPREAETIRHLVHGLTTKEVAQQMRVSPNTVKQFVRIAMSKIGVTTRSGLVGKVLGG